MSRYYDPRIPERDNWRRSEKYHNSFLIKPDAGLEHALTNSEANGLPHIQVSPALGKHLFLIAKTLNAKRVLEVGTLGGYSGIWFARALPADGKVVTAEISQKHADVAKANFEYAGVADKVDVIVGPAVETLPKLSASEPFDVAFIDADKESNAIYYKEARRLLRKGGAIIVDNVVRGGKVADPDVNDKDVIGVRELLQAIKDDDGVEATTIATAGERNYDGFTYIVVL